MIWYVIPMAILHLISISFILLKFVRSPELFLSKLFLNTKTTILAINFLIGGILITTLSIVYEAVYSADPIMGIISGIGSLSILIFYFLLIKIQIYESAGGGV